MTHHWIPSLPQSGEFARTCEILGRPLQVHSMGNSARWQVQSRRIAVLGQLDLISRGPLLVSPDLWPDWVDRFRHHQGRHPVIINTDGPAPGALRDAGFIPLMTPASIGVVPLAKPELMRQKLAQKWRNRLNRAEAGDLQVTRHSLDQGHWLIAADQRQARARGYGSWPKEWLLAFARANPGKAQVWEVARSGQPLAGVLVLRHGPMATWQIGHVTDEGRKLCAMNLALFSAMSGLARAGHDWLDLGAINTQDAPGLAHFKLGTGAALHRLGGSWLYHPALSCLARRMPLHLAGRALAAA